MHCFVSELMCCYESAFFSSQGSVAALAFGMELRSILINVGVEDHELVEGIGERLVDIVVETSLIVKASWLPELGNVGTASVVIIENKLTSIANDEESCKVCLASH